MKQHNFQNEHTILNLVSEYEAMSQKGTVVSIEEKDFFRLIEYYQDKYLFRNVFDVINHGLIQYPQSIRLYIRKAQLEIEISQVTDAMVTLKAAQNLAPADLEQMLIRIEALCSVGNLQEASYLIADLLPEPAEDEVGSSVFWESQMSGYSNQFESMYHTLKGILLEDPADDDALERIWVCIEFLHKYEESIELHQKILDVNPYSYRAWYNLGQAYTCLGNLEKAAMAFEYAYLANENFQDAYRECAAIHFDLKKYDKALQCYEEILENFSVDCDLLMNIGKCYAAMKDYQTAKAYYLQAIKLDPQKDEAHFLFGLCLSHLNDWKKAVNSFKKAIKLENRKEEYYAGLAEAYYHLGYLEEAARSFQIATEIAPDIIIYWIQYISFLLESGQPALALQVLEEAETYTDDSSLSYCRIACLFQMGNRKEAIYRFIEALTHNYSMHTSLFDLHPDLEFDPDVQKVLMNHGK